MFILDYLNINNYRILSDRQCISKYAQIQEVRQPLKQTGSTKMKTLAITDVDPRMITSRNILDAFLFSDPLFASSDQEYTSNYLVLWCQQTKI